MFVYLCVPRARRAALQGCLRSIITNTKNNNQKKLLTVVDISLTDAKGCADIYPAVVALARTFKGFASFGRLHGDESDGATKRVLDAYAVKAVPTFLFFKDGKEVGRHVGSSRGDLIARILEEQARHGVLPPPLPAKEVKARRVQTRRVGKGVWK